MENRRVRLIFVIFFASGFSALLYQVVWQRMLGLFSGSDVYAATIITGAYLAGLGAGSLLGSAVADRLSSRAAVRLYGLCNALIAAFAVVSRPLFYDGLFVNLNAVTLSPAALLGIAFAVLLLPTLLMGLSLPLLSRALVRDLRDAPRLIGWLYAVNTLGAGVGTLLGGWVLAGTLGFERSLYLGAGISAGVSAAALALATRFSTDRQTAVTAARTPIPRSVWVWCGLVFVSGFVAISLEMVGFRVLVVLMKSNAYTYAHFLAFVLIGDAIGSVYGARAARRVQNPRQTFLALQGVIALYAVAVIVAFAFVLAGNPRLQEYFAQTAGRLELANLTSYGAALSFVVYVVLPALILLPPNLLLGYYFPLVQKAIQTDVGAVGQRVGLTGVANIAGNAAGSLVTGLIILEWFGARGALTLIGLIGLAFTALWLRGARGRRWLGVALAAALVAALVAFPDPATLWTRMLGYASTAGTWVAEDASGVSVLRVDGTRAILYVDGIEQGEVPFLTVHTYLGIAPALTHPDPERALVIGVGSGGTPFGVGVNPALERIIAVEIVGSEIPVLRAYAEQAPESPLRALFADPRVEIVIGDGRRVLAQAAQPFDIIEADPLYPWRSHAGMLYSREYFEDARARLAEGGLMAQWLPTPRAQATFLAVFPYVVDAGMGVMLGSNEPIPFDLEQMLARLDDPAIRAYLERGQVDLAAIRAALRAHTPRAWMPESPRDRADVNTDLFPKDEYYLNTALP